MENRTPKDYDRWDGATGVKIIKKPNDTEKTKLQPNCYCRTKTRRK